MTILHDATTALNAIEAELHEPTPSGLDLVRVAERIRAVRLLLSSQAAQWIGTTEAKRLLGVSSENTVKVWARQGLLRSRTLPNGRTQVLLEDVLRRREETEGLSAIGNDKRTGFSESSRSFPSHEMTVTPAKTQITRQQALAYKERWRLGHEMDVTDLQQTSPHQKMRQLQSLWVLGQALGWLERLEGRDQPMSENWLRLRRALRG